MKKILSLALSAVVALGALAQVPNTFNYQGLAAETNSEIQVTFKVLCDNELVYTENQTLVTNEKGAFSTVIGKKTDATWSNIDWTAGEYTVVTLVNGAPVSTTALQAVPYANVAASVVGLSETQQDVMDLVLANRETQAALADIEVWQANVGENLEMLTPVIEQLLESAETQDAVIEQLVGFVGEDGPVAALELGLTQLANRVEENSDMIEQLVGFVGEDGPVAALELGLTQLANRVEENSDMIEQLVGFVGEDGPIAALELGLTQLSNRVEDNTALIEALEARIAALEGTASN